ncbi:molybdenum cofactor biosynthesis prote [Thelephora ganbajun]|uniref:Molybdenum cofactor biosynthesis prote n=1 Tax=Thelephora ganbajun TaxID=370292 RepID=A0ACB6ZPY2_THEGA|nr:molybdenum cofactor biosynthesis prote [Thelephora ganbajun]
MHNYLRISLTERCNLRCFYCMPKEGVELAPKAHLLSDDEVIRLAEMFVKQGVTKIRLTGGEPTVRKGVVELVGRLKNLRQYGLCSIGMTSNGIALHRMLPRLVENGLTHLNLSLDTLDPFKFEIMTRRRGHDAVLKTLDIALSSNLQSVKLNAVIIKDLNDTEVPDFVELTKDKDISVRFIEFMPFTGNKWDKARMVSSSVLLTNLQKRYPTIIKATDELNDTARSYRIPGYTGSFGFISSMSDHFCSSCNRLRLTADGQIKVCLFDAKEISLRDLLRSGTSDNALLQTIGFAVRGKKEKHAGMEDIDVVTNRPMILIGGLKPRRTESNLKNRTTYSLNSTVYTDPRPNKLSIHRSRFLTTTVRRSDVPYKSLTHFDTETGRARMVDVGSKSNTQRTATASGRILIPKVAHDLIASHGLPITTDDYSEGLREAREKARKKGDVLAVSQLAGIMACKRTAELIPLCHPLPITHIDVLLIPEVRGDGVGTEYSVRCEATVSCTGKTGVEMEALTAVSVALLNVWDMLKAVAGKEMEIRDIVVNKKSGGKSGDFSRPPV